MEPYKVVIHNPIKSESRVIVFVGNVPGPIRSELDKLEKNTSYASQKLAKHYGKRWKNILGVKQASGGGSTIADDTDQFEELIAATEHVYEQNSALQFATTEIYAMDKISEVKEKIFVATGIQPFRQHLWTDDQQHVGYKIISDVSINLDIYSHIKLPTVIDNIYINMEWYAAQTVKIMAYDDFKIASQFNRTFQMIDLYDFVAATNYKETELIYNGFVRMFFPMLNSYNIFTSWLKQGLADYPLLMPDRKVLAAKYKVESAILNEDPPVKFQKTILAAIAHSIITTTGNTQISTRNIFDKVKLTDDYPQCQLHLIVNGKSITFNKQLVAYESPP